MKKLTFLLLFFGTAAFAQKNAQIEVLGDAQPKEVILRWAPDKPVAWQIGLKSGYYIDRYTVYKGGKIDTADVRPKRITTTAIKPLPLDDWEPLVNGDKYAAIAAQAIYGDDFELNDPSGDQASFLNQASELENRYGFALMSADLSANVAAAMGLRFVDKNIKEGERYVYKIYFADSINSNYAVDTGSFYIDPANIKKLPKPKELQIEVGDKSIGLSWESYYHNKVYVSYIIERSDDEGQTFSRRDDVPFLNVSSQNNPRRTYYLDSLPYNNKVYFYRVKGLTPFGTTGPPSEAIKGVGLTSAKGIIAQIDSTSITFDGRVNLLWSFPAQFQEKILGFKVARANNARGPFQNMTDEVIPAYINKFTDTAPGPTNYYVVKAIGKDGTETVSFPVLVQPEDSIPPNAPKGLSGKVTENGLVSIKWSPNSETDLSGYRVYRANSKKEEFFQITSGELSSSQFVDSISLNTLTEEIFYRVIAEDYHGNPSDYSAILHLERPDIIPPSPPVFKHFKVDQTHVSLSWSKSPSEDVIRYELKRIYNGDTLIVKAFKADDFNGSFTDKNLLNGEYTYLLTAHDDDSLVSEVEELSINITANKSSAALEKIRSRVDREDRIIELSWTQSKDVSRVIIYRKKGEEPIRLYKSTKNSSFTDKSLNVNSVYEYRLKAILSNGKEQTLSGPIKVVY